MKLLILLTLTLVVQLTFAQTTRVVSKESVLPPELTGYPKDTTLLDAYCAISTTTTLNPCPDSSPPFAGPYFVSDTYNIILYGDTPVPVGISTLIWEKSGTATHSINIYSYGEQVTLTRPSSPTNGSVLKLLNVENVNIFNIHFENATHAITLDNADHCSITYCRFTGDVANGQMQDAAIWIGKGAIQGFNASGFDTATNNYPEASFKNEISYNLFEDQKFSDYCLSRHNHGIYVSHGNRENLIYGNTIRARQTNVAPYPIGLGIHINHGYAKYNKIANNFIDQHYYKTTTLQSCAQPNAWVCPPANYDQWQHSRYGIDLNTDAGPPLTSISNNVITGNYISTNVNIECSVEPTLAFYTGSSLRSTNQVPSISESSYSYDPNHYYDPYWNSHASGALSAVATLAGNFDNDDKPDDIAVIYEYPGAVTKIHVWKYLDGTQLTDANPDYKQQAFFEYHGVKWSSVGLGGFNADKIRGRVVSGSFDMDDRRDDIATIYDNGTGGIEINMFLWNQSTNTFDYQGGSNNWKSFSTGFTASMVTGRVVSGDFNNDELDDIATFYPKNTTGCNINMFLSTGSSFDYEGASQSWWSVSSGFNLSKIIDRVVSGDFDNDGHEDDIAAFFDAGTNATEVEMFRSNGAAFAYEGGSLNWWTNSGLGNFDSNKIKGRIVSGDFDGDSKVDDIAAFYDDGGNSMRIDLFRSSGSKPLIYEGGTSAWWSTENNGGYNAAKITGHVVSGNFSSARDEDDILAFYDYRSISGNTRTNVWESDGDDFEYVNGALGYPWALAPNAIEGRSRTNHEKISSPELTPDEDQIEEFAVYPNPTSRLITVQYELDSDAAVSLNLYSDDGRQTEFFKNEQKKGLHQMEFNTSSLKPGLYVLMLKYNTRLLTRKFVVKHN